MSLIVRETPCRKHFAHITDPALLAELLEDKTSYGDTFFVPIRARWNEQWTDENGDQVPALKDLKENIGSMLNKALAAVEDENDALACVLKNNIDFNAIKGKRRSPIRSGRISSTTSTSLNSYWSMTTSNSQTS
jgi:type I restriction enzyme M protein